jgi:hypothetical protein
VVVLLDGRSSAYVFGQAGTYWVRASVAVRLGPGGKRVTSKPLRVEVRDASEDEDAALTLWRGREQAQWVQGNAEEQDPPAPLANLLDQFPKSRYGMCVADAVRRHTLKLLPDERWLDAAAPEIAWQDATFRGVCEKLQAYTGVRLSCDPVYADSPVSRLVRPTTMRGCLGLLLELTWLNRGEWVQVDGGYRLVQSLRPAPRRQAEE